MDPIFPMDAPSFTDSPPATDCPPAMDSPSPPDISSAIGIPIPNAMPPDTIPVTFSANEPEEMSSAFFSGLLNDEIARAMDKNKVPAVYFGDGLLALFGLKIEVKTSSWVIPNTLMDTAVGIITEMGLKECPCGTECEQLRDEDEPFTSAHHFHIPSGRKTPFPILHLYWKGDLLDDLPEPWYGEPSLNNPYFMLDSDDRVEKIAGAPTERVTPPGQRCPIRIPTVSAFEEATRRLWNLYGKSHPHMKWATYEVMLAEYVRLHPPEPFVVYDRGYPRPDPVHSGWSPSIATPVEGGIGGLFRREAERERERALEFGHGPREDPSGLPW
ncbi:hypothetical protein BO70DRAFT_394453 [Aspergillus heteromorphus CBS 117.55]|uniref:Uncharacterized protein n=1 Tax=Aspergillus heteromorphus CBS 117.55 TaxID=1448321 RepID=A0A317WR24_9EURO|nr:uncharacterized protein BO70DRAFT_394453 [Aspergillus heteromorphus CBS 117.55]PWY87567.1 hypothetical protein BO70DRAFT_394453 [Aspergillus heteromorphus CBS 117.55]